MASRPTIETLAASTLADPSKLAAQLRLILQDLERQIGTNPLVSYTDGPTDRGLKKGDPIFRFKGGVLQIGIFDGRNSRFLNTTDLQSLQTGGTFFRGIQTGTAAPTIPANFPNPNDWGFYDRTAGAPGLYICYHRPSTGTLSTLLL